MSLSVTQRIELVEDLWDSIVAVPEAIELTEDQKEILDERLEKMNKNPDKGIPWDEFRKLIRK